ncbi:hypothetical protein [Chryseobacterium sp.]|uniref:Crp/Fnr family transcriptional regulator n=1 Tax=Chryseobacterium sp. TaxID=1871047 RepID=UPI0028525035|nr:hypothetical protein [Chryseobacterium sp.]
MSEGDFVNHEYFVLEGCLKAFYLNDSMKMFILQFAMPTWWVTDFDALYSKTRATINVDCITNATILSISNEDREKICNEIHEVEHFFRWRTNKGYVAAQKTRTRNYHKNITRCIGSHRQNITISITDSFYGYIEKGSSGTAKE